MRMKRLYLAEESMLKFHDTKLLSIIWVQLSAEMSTKENEEQFIVIVRKGISNIKGYHTKAYIVKSTMPLYNYRV